MTTMRTFIRENRDAIDQHINQVRSRGRGFLETEKYNDKDRYEWILNDEDLYRWAKSAGVPI